MNANLLGVIAVIVLSMLVFSFISIVVAVGVSKCIDYDYIIDDEEQEKYLKEHFK